MVFILKLWSGVLLSFGYRSFSCDTGYHSYLTWCYGVSFYCSYDFISITFLQFDYEVPFVLLLGVGEELSEICWASWISWVLIFIKFLVFIYENTFSVPLFFFWNLATHIWVCMFLFLVIFLFYSFWIISVVTNRLN